MYLHVPVQLCDFNSQQQPHHCALSLKLAFLFRKTQTKSFPFFVRELRLCLSVLFVPENNLQTLECRVFPLPPAAYRRRANKDQKPPQKQHNRLAAIWTVKSHRTKTSIYRTTFEPLKNRVLISFPRIWRQVLLCMNGGCV